MSFVLDLVIAGSRIATAGGVALIVVALAALVWLAVRNWPRRSAGEPAEAPRSSEANTVRRHRHSSRRSARPVVRHPALDERTVTIPVLRDQTELIPRIGGGRRG